MNIISNNVIIRNNLMLNYVFSCVYKTRMPIYLNEFNILSLLKISSGTI